MPITPGKFKAFPSNIKQTISFWDILKSSYLLLRSTPTAHLFILMEDLIKISNNTPWSSFVKVDSR